MEMSERSAAQTSEFKPPSRFDRQLLIVLALAAVVVTSRSLLIQAAHCETIDSEYHLNRGLAFLTGTMGERILNDPPLGEALSAMPMWLMGCYPSSSARGLYGYAFRPEIILAIIAVWKSLLFVPMVALVFGWCRKLYGSPAGWLATAMLLIDPTFAAHVGLPTVDVLGAEGVLFACILAWRYFQVPSLRRLNIACLTVALALTLKHTAALVPIIVVVYAALWWHVRPWLIKRSALPGEAAIGVPSWRTRLGIIARAAIIIPLALWALMLFDFSAPASFLYERPGAKPEPQLIRASWPAGMYAGSFISGMRHNAEGHDNYLLGEAYRGARWYYFPVVASYKVPLGIAAVMAMALLSLVTVRPRWDEWSLFIPMVGYTLWLMTARINIGFRHFLPAYVFMIMLAARCIAPESWRWLRAAAWIAIGTAALHVLSYHPDYLSYINWPRHKPYLAISDSNIDWGQSLKQVRAWTRSFEQHDKRRVYIRYFGNDRESIRYYLTNRLPHMAVLGDTSTPPNHGVLIISAVRVAGVYDHQDRYASLRRVKPIATIGHSMLVYDLDALRDHEHFRWSKPKKGRPAGKVYEE